MRGYCSTRSDAHIAAQTKSGLAACEVERDFRDQIIQDLLNP
jgi:hypothetical protein